VRLTQLTGSSTPVTAYFGIRELSENLIDLKSKFTGSKKTAEYFGTHCGQYFVEIPLEEFVGHGKNRVIINKKNLCLSLHTLSPY